MARIFVLNGVNLGALGERRPEVYGTKTLQDIEQLLRGGFPGVDLEVRQTDYEGEFVGLDPRSRGLRWPHRQPRSLDPLLLRHP